MTPSRGEKMKKIIFILMLVLLLQFGCTEQKPPHENKTMVVEYGDVVSVNYILTVDGRVIDTNIEEVARNNNIYSIYRDYKPLKFSVLLGENNLLPSFVKAVVDMKENETKEVIIKPRDGYGEYNYSLTYNVSRYYNKSKYEKVPRSFFEKNNITIEEGKGFPTEIGLVFIDSFDNETVTINYFFNKGDSFDYNGFHQVVVEENNDSYLIMYDVRENGTYKTTSPITKEKTIVRVVALTNETMTIDENHPLAGKTLTFNITVVGIEKQ